MFKATPKVYVVITVMYNCTLDVALGAFKGVHLHLIGVRVNRKGAVITP